MRVMMEIDLVQMTLSGKPGSAPPIFFGGRTFSSGGFINQ
jgi:hypothetical protein